MKVHVWALCAGVGIFTGGVAALAQVGTTSPIPSAMSPSPLPIASPVVPNRGGTPSVLKESLPAASSAPLFVLTLSTGAVAPKYFHRDVVTIQADGNWHAAKVYPYHGGGHSVDLGKGHLSHDQLAAILQIAFMPCPDDAPSFMQLQGPISDHTMGSGTSSLVVRLADGSHEVDVVGRRPEGFQRLAEAIAKATTGIKKLDRF